jgi:hypothetical protein
VQLLFISAKFFTNLSIAVSSSGSFLVRSNVTVYLADRSGILGTENFDIHEVSEFRGHCGAVAE